MITPIFSFVVIVTISVLDIDALLTEFRGGTMGRGKALYPYA